MSSPLLSAQAQLVVQELWRFVNEECIPVEAAYFEDCKDSHGNWKLPAVMEQLKERARQANLWNLFLPKDCPTDGFNGFSNEEYAIMCEIIGRSFLAAEACNCSAPDTGNMEVLLRHGTPAQKETYLQPLLTGEVRSAFLMTEPDVASSDPTNLTTTIERITNPATGAIHYRINGKKWWSSGAMHPKCRFALVVCRMVNKEFEQESKHTRHTIVVVPMDTPGVRVIRPLTVFGFDDAPHGHAEVHLHDVDVPAECVVLGEGRGLEIAQSRLGPGRIHHCMRAIGLAERALEAMVERAEARETFGVKLKDHGMVANAIAQSRVQINQARLLVLDCARRLDESGAHSCKQEIAALKTVVPMMACEVIDRSIQVHGGLGVCQDTFLARAYAGMRALRIADGPDEVHIRTVAKLERPAHDLQSILDRYYPRSTNHLAAVEQVVPKATAATQKQQPAKPRSPRAHVSGYPALTPQHCSLMARYLTPELYAKLSQLRTSYGTTLDDLIQIGVESPELHIGIIAHDPECFVVFRELLDPILASWHHTRAHMAIGTVVDSNLLAGMNAETFHMVDQVLQSSLVNRVRLEIARNVDGFPFEPTITRSDRRELESLVVRALDSLPEELRGRYLATKSLTDEQLASFKRSRLLTEFTKDFVSSSYNLLRDWPDGRGVWCSNYADLVAWVNTEDHIRLVVSCDGHACKESLGELVKTYHALEATLSGQGFSFAQTPELGYLCTSATFVGTGLRFSAIARLERLGRIPRRLGEICLWLGLGLKPLDYSHCDEEMAAAATTTTSSSSSSSTAVPLSVVVRPLLFHPEKLPQASEWEVFNKSTLGTNLGEIMKTVGKGLNTLLQIEQRLQNEPTVDPNEVIQDALGGEYHLYGPVLNTQPDKLRARL